MTVLDEWRDSSCPDLLFRCYEALIHTSTAHQRDRWVHDGVPFFETALQNLWELYSQPRSPYDSFYTEYEWLERRAFMNYSCFIALDSNDTVGGIWSASRSNHHKRSALMHIVADLNHRKAAPVLLHTYLQRMRFKVDTIECEWGYRTADNDPTAFLVRNGFELDLNRSGRAVYTFPSQHLINHLQKVS